MVNFLEVVKESPEAGEKALAKIAHREGDEVAVQILEKISVQDLSAMLLQADFSTLSVSGLLLTPEMVVGVMEYIPSTWRNYSTETVLKEVADLLTFLLLGRDDEEWFCSTMDAISFSEVAICFLALPYWSKFKKFSPVIQTFDSPDIDVVDFDIDNQEMSIDLEEVSKKVLDTFTEVEKTEGGIGRLFNKISQKCPFLTEQLVDKVLGGKLSLKEVIFDLIEMVKEEFRYGEFDVNEEARRTFKKKEEFGYGEFDVNEEARAAF